MKKIKISNVPQASAEFNYPVGFRRTDQDRMRDRLSWMYSHSLPDLALAISLLSNELQIQIMRTQMHIDGGKFDRS